MADFIIGLTGGIGSGKTTVSTLFSELGVEIVDADIIAREVVAPNTHALANIVEHFGSKILLSNKQLNRALLRECVFSNPKEKSWLNALLHPLIRENLLAQIQASQGEYCILSAPLLLENNLQTLVNRVLIIDVSEQTQVIRTTKRDQSSKRLIQEIINSQVNREQRLAAADDIIDNESSNLANLKKSVLELHQQYRLLSQRNK
jgi:dephospho-CoA kinase